MWPSTFLFFYVLRKPTLHYTIKAIYLEINEIALTIQVVLILIKPVLWSCSNILLP